MDDRYHGASRLQVGSALVTLYLVWGSTYLGIRVIVVNGMPPLPSMGLRFLIAGLLLGLVIVGRNGPAALRLTRRQLLSTAVIGLLLVFGGNGLVAVAEQDVPSGLAALLISVTPLLLAGMRVATGDRPHPLTWLGVAFGFSGIAILVRPTGASGWLGPVTVLAAALCWSTGSMISKQLLSAPDPFVSAAYQMVIAGIAQIVVGAGIEGLDGLGPDTPREGWTALVYLILVGSLLGYTSYYWLLAHAPISLVTTYTYVNPVVAVLLGWLVLSEQVTVRMLLGGAVALTGVVFVISAERLPTRTAAPGGVTSVGLSHTGKP